MGRGFGGFGGNDFPRPGGGNEQQYFLHIENCMKMIKKWFIGYNPEKLRGLGGVGVTAVAWFKMGKPKGNKTLFCEYHMFGGGVKGYPPFRAAMAPGVQDPAPLRGNSSSRYLSPELVRVLEIRAVRIKRRDLDLGWKFWLVDLCDLIKPHPHPHPHPTHHPTHPTHTHTQPTHPLRAANARGPPAPEAKAPGRCPLANRPTAAAEPKRGKLCRQLSTNCTSNSYRMGVLERGPFSSKDLVGSMLLRVQKGTKGTQGGNCGAGVS